MTEKSTYHRSLPACIARKKPVTISIAAKNTMKHCCVRTVWTMVLLLVGMAGPLAKVYAQDETTTEPVPLPLHGIEGMGGVCSTYSAYLTNPATADNVFGLPSVGAGYINLGHGRNLTVLTATETLWNRLEFGFGWNRFDLGDLPHDVERATGIAIGDDYVELVNLNARLLLINEGDWNCWWLPAVTAGIHYKHNATIDDIDDDLGGVLEGIGIDRNDGLDFTLYTSKVIPYFSRPVLLNMGFRASKGAHLGLLGFTDDYHVTPELNTVVFVSDSFALAGEYRWKPDDYDDDLAPLIENEDDWWTLCACYLITNSLTISGGYGHFGSVLNHDANGSWAVKTKWEF